MTVTTQQMQADVDRLGMAVAQQLAEDPDHVVALAMLRADVRRAQAALTARIRENVEAINRQRRGTTKREAA